MSVSVEVSVVDTGVDDVLFVGGGPVGLSETGAGAGFGGGMGKATGAGAGGVPLGA